MTLQEIKGVIIDLGKTLMFFQEGYELGPRISHLLEISEREVDNRIIDLYTSHVNLDPQEFVKLLCQNLKSPKISDIDQVLEEICSEYVRSATLQEDALYTLERLRSRHLKITLISNTTPLTKLCLTNLGLQQLFDCIVLSCDIGILKPDPRIFLHAMNLMGTEPQETCIIGDRIRTIVLGGAILNARTVLVERQMEGILVSARLSVEAIIPTLKDVLALPFLRGERIG